MDNLKKQFDKATENNKQLLQRIDTMLERIASQEEVPLQKGESLEKQKRVNKGPLKLFQTDSKNNPGTSLGGETESARDRKVKKRKG